MLGRKSNISTGSGKRFFESDRQAILIAPGNQGNARRSTHCGVGIGLQEFHSLTCEAVDVRRLEVSAAVAGEVGGAKIVSQDEKHVRRRVKSVITDYGREKRHRRDGASGEEVSA